jgi:hypothetical protein
MESGRHTSRFESSTLTHGEARRGKAGQGEAGLGKARRGEGIWRVNGIHRSSSLRHSRTARPGKAWHG